MSKQYLAAEVAMWLQRKCGESWEFLGCHNLSGISVPRGDTNPVYCRTGKNTFAIQRTWKGTPGLGSASIMAYESVFNVLQEMKCAFNLAVLHSGEGADDDPTNFDYLYYYNGMEITGEETDTHVAGLNPDEQKPITLTMPTTFRSRVKVKRLLAQARDLSDMTGGMQLNGVAFCDSPSCDNFGNLSSVGCQIGYVASSSDGQPAGTSATVLKTSDGGGTWEDLGSPFTNQSDNVIDIDCDGDVVVAVNGVTPGYAYSWDGGTSWTTVSTSKLLNKVYILSSTKIWFMAQDGTIYYSNNRGVTVAAQEDGSTTVQSLNDISAADTLTLYAVGDNNTIIKTIDGGNIWFTLAGPATSIYPNDLYKVVAVPSTDIVLVGDEQGNVYRSGDGGSTWSLVFANTNLAGGIRGMAVCDCNVIMIAGNTQDPYFYGASEGFVYQSVDGGNSWFGVELPTNAGVLDLICCDVNKYWAVGLNGFAALIAG